MLGKLMKYEWKATARLFLPFYGAILVFAVINRFFLMFNQGNANAGGILALPSGLSMMVYVLAIVATFVLTYVVMIQRYYKNLLGDEGYLSFTLPVKPQQHILAKLLVSAAWIVISLAVTCISLVAMLAQADFFTKLGEIITAFNNWDAGGYKGLYVLLVIFISIVSLFEGILFIYAAISIGQLFSRHKLAASFGAFIALNFVTQIVSSIVMVIAYTIDPRVFTNNTQPSNEFMIAMFSGVLLFNLVFGVAYYVISHILLNKKLNLE